MSHGAGIEKFEALEKQRNQLRSVLKLSDSLRLELAFDSTHAINDLARGLANLFPHKRSLAKLGHLPSPLSEVIKGFATEGFAIQEIPVNLKSFDEGQAEAAFASLKKDTLFVLGSFQASPLDSLYPTKWLREKCREKQLFFLAQVSSEFLSHRSVLPETPFEAFVYNPGLATTNIHFWIGGERCQGESLLWGKPHFENSAFLSLKSALPELFERAKVQAVQNKNAEKTIFDFESRVVGKIPGAKALLPPNGVGRLWNRASLSFEGCDGSALVSMLEKKGYDVLTLSACFSESPHLPQWLVDSGFSASELQSSLLVNLETLSKSGFLDDLSEIVNYLRKMSGHN